MSTFTAPQDFLLVAAVCTGLGGGDAAAARGARQAVIDGAAALAGSAERTCVVACGAKLDWREERHAAADVVAAGVLKALGHETFAPDRNVLLLDTASRTLFATARAVESLLRLHQHAGPVFRAGAPVHVVVREADAAEAAAEFTKALGGDAARVVVHAAAFAEAAAGAGAGAAVPPHLSPPPTRPPAAPPKSTAISFEEALRGGGPGPAPGGVTEDVSADDAYPQEE